MTLTLSNSLRLEGDIKGYPLPEYPKKVGKCPNTMSKLHQCKHEQLLVMLT